MIRIAAMSMQEAKEILGISADSSPSPEEINQIYRELAKKLHPDVGGSHDDMVALNAAKEVLIQGESIPAPSRPSTERQTRVIQTSLEEALANANVPSGVKWIFASNTGYGDASMGAFSFHGTVFYGKTDAEHVFLGIEHESGQNPFEMIEKDIWTCFVSTAPVSNGLSDVAPREIRNMFDRFYGLRKGYNAKVTVLPEDFEITERNAVFPKGKEMSFKDAMVNLGLVGGEHRWSANQKLKVTMIYNEKYGEGKAVPSIIIDINGREFKLNEVNTEIMTKNYNRVLDAIMGKSIYDGSKKELTRAKDGKKILAMLANKLTGEPEELIELLTKASEQMK
jgi:hypothetical protein